MPEGAVWVVREETAHLLFAGTEANPILCFKDQKALHHLRLLCLCMADNVDKIHEDMSVVKEDTTTASSGRVRHRQPQVGIPNVNHLPVLPYFGIPNYDGLTHSWAHQMARKALGQTHSTDPWCHP